MDNSLHGRHSYFYTTCSNLYYDILVMKVVSPSLSYIANNFLFWDFDQGVKAIGF